MKRNFFLLIVVLLLATAWGLYFHWPKAAYEDKPVPLNITCVNNLKQIGIGFRLWSGDHGDKNPFEVSTNAGGTRELTLAGADGYYQNVWLFLQAMSNELTIPLLLICPQDTQKQPAAAWANLTATDISYQFPVATNGSTGKPKILPVCPVDGNILYDDGSVLPSKQYLASHPDDKSLRRGQ